MNSENLWFKIHDKRLGLRSEDNRIVIKGTGASYAMDMGLDYKFRDPLPARWEDLLKGTITTMKSFTNSNSRFLLIVNNSCGNAADSEYPGCFPKCSSRADSILASIELSNDVNTLVDWVKRALNDIN